jgi:glycosyltransferase involved in cell wall biosynthesis
MKHFPVSVIIPVYNEVRTIASVLQIVLTWGKAKEIIVVNDGSHDKTLQAIDQFKKQIKLISYKRNKGKGYALYRGIEASNEEILMFLDGDLVGMTHKDLDAMVAPMVTHSADMVLGVARFSSIGSFEPFNAITGQRLVYRKEVLPLSVKWKTIGYGVEVMLNEAYKNKRVTSIRLPYVFILGKLEKQKIPDAMVSYIKEGRDMLTQIIKDQTDTVKPHARRIIQMVINYLQEAIS